MTRIIQSPLANVLNIRVDAIDMERAVRKFCKILRDERKGYVCVAGVHGIMEAQRSRALAEVYAQADLTIPDGMPLVWVGHAQGYRDMQRVTGPDFMLRIFHQSEYSGTTHYLYGGEAGVADQLREIMCRRFPGARIVGSRTPPFRDLNKSEERELIEEIRFLHPDVIWVGISCPKQELFMYKYLPLLDTKVMVGVGAAFDYHTGRIRDSSEWVKRAGLQWLHRLIQDPKRLWKRHLRNNPVFLFQITRQLLLERLHEYPKEPAPELVTADSELGFDDTSKPQEASGTRSAVA